MARMVQNYLCSLLEKQMGKSWVCGETILKT